MWDHLKRRSKQYLVHSEPQNSSEVRSFLGLANYKARFIPSFATVAEPLRRLTKEGELFEFGPEQQTALKELKKRLAHAETLGYFDKDAKTRIVADASPVGLGAILIQEQDGEDRVISYASKSLTDVERRYSQTEKEALALVWACERFHVYLYGIEIELCTDHKPLETIYSTKSKPEQELRDGSCGCSHTTSRSSTCWKREHRRSSIQTVTGGGANETISGTERR